MTSLVVGLAWRSLDVHRSRYHRNYNLIRLANPSLQRRTLLSDLTHYNWKYQDQACNFYTSMCIPVVTIHDLIETGLNPNYRKLLATYRT